MTGSGKTGLCIALLEEAAIDGIPAIAIDPKGDLGNLLLAFPSLAPADFRPWIDEDDARRQGLSPDEFAARTAAEWTKGLADWGQDGARIERFRSAADAAIYTPGSSAGIPLSILRSLGAPPAALAQDADALRERVLAAASGLLALLGIEADPIRSREHILLSNVLDRTWREGADADLGGLVRKLQSPPFDRVGVVDLESFFPARERAEFAMRLNNLLASPGFAAWLEGEPLDVGRLLRTPEGKPRLSVLSIAHLSDPERMFFVTLLLNEVVAWMRTQPGTASLRAALYMDEVFGFFPPTANPPSKVPMLTLLKQARAFGLGVVLATQNPVDLDYKGLSNAGTWFLGRLQTERDKERVLDGLEGAVAAAGEPLDRGRMDKILSGLGKRVFLMNDVHEDEPVVFQTRSTLSYLRGPLTRGQIRSLTEARKSTAKPPPPSSTTAPPAPAAIRAATSGQEVASQDHPLLPPGIAEFFLPTAEGGKCYRPALLGAARVHYVDTKAGVDQWEKVALLGRLAEPVAADPWDRAEAVDPGSLDLVKEPGAGTTFAPLPAEAARAASHAAWTKMFPDALYRGRTLAMWRCAALGIVSIPGESEGDFRARVAQTDRERRDASVEKLRKQYAPRLQVLADQVRRAEERTAREQEQYQQEKIGTAISIGATVLGALFGRKLASVGNVGRVATTARRMSRAGQERQDVERATENVGVVKQRLEDLEAEFQSQVAALQGAAAGAPQVETFAVRPRKSDISVERVALVWIPS